ncbi:phage tail sheath protein [Virgibacillus halodenitrificans]|uniref:phage tail sheath subtilisin-like domain-containing protein n=1 Tax=Virgibacillus halodenitrificans TaxID=1482 RepID=UPI00136D51AA|nr:phage tail sheath subtilisin-like domain-containing protein [Virgibacillus halodenitrificans]MYL45055.1 phage tail sheath protein [Virgibacillus halodenitrificans]
MARGEWSPTEEKVLAGFYMRFISAARKLISPSPRGIVAIPVKANWGPVNKVVDIVEEGGLINNFGKDTGGEFTAYNTVNLAILGQPSKILVYRLTDGTEKKAAITLTGGSTPSDSLKLETVYPTDRNFNVTVRESLEGAGKQELVLFEGTKQLSSYTFSSVDEAVSQINADSVYITATKVADGSLTTVSNQAFTGGNAGTTTITNEEYIKAMTAFEAKTFNAFALDGPAATDLQTTVVGWVKRLRSQGKRIMAFLGGALADDKDPTVGNERSRSFNHEGVINVTVSGELGDKLYPSGDIAAYVAGLASSQQLHESLTFAATPFTDVQPAMTPEQRAEAVKSGSFILFEEDGVVKCERGINTLTSYGADQDPSFSKIKITRLKDAIDTDLSNTANSQYVGKLINNEDGQAALLSAIKAYFETLTPNLIASDFVVQKDEELMKNAAKDQFFWEYYVTDVDSMEEIYGTGNHQ